MPAVDVSHPGVSRASARFATATVPALLTAPKRATDATKVPIKEVQRYGHKSTADSSPESRSPEGEIRQCVAPLRDAQYQGERTATNQSQESAGEEQPRYEPTGNDHSGQREETCPAKSPGQGSTDNASDTPQQPFHRGPLR